MYLPETGSEIPFFQLESNLTEQTFPNVTKGISDVLKMCDSAGLDPNGLGCGLSVI
jgi:hypothetical protein